MPTISVLNITQFLNMFVLNKNDGHNLEPNNQVQVMYSPRKSTIVELLFMYFFGERKRYSFAVYIKWQFS